MHELMFVGGYTRATADGPGAAQGIATVAWGEANGVFDLRHVTPGYDNPSWLAFDAVRQRLYATSEVGEWIEGLVVAYAVDIARGTLVFSGLTGSGGSAPCHIGLSPDGSRLAVANYGTADPALGADHALCIIEAATLRRIGSFSPMHRYSPNARQQRSHGHFAEFSNDGATVAFVDLGEDALIELPADDPTTPARRIEFPAGAGPRHFVRSPRTGHRYLALELDGSIAAIGPDGIGEIVRLGGQPSGIRCSADGRFVYVALRQLDQIAVLATGDNGRLELIQFAPCGGRTPRDLVLSTTGSTLLVANQDSNALAALPVDAGTGRLGPIRASLAIGAPSSLAIVGMTA